MPQIDPQGLFLAILALLLVSATLFVVALKFAGLSATQIRDLVALTIQFFRELLGAFRSENAEREKVKGKTD